MTIAEFILARIAEDEDVAEAALERGFGGWEYFADRGVNHEARTHIARQHPAHVLAECKAKRQIVEVHAPVDNGPDGWCTICDGDGWPCATMAALSSVYADHPDFRDEWRP